MGEDAQGLKLTGAHDAVTAFDQAIGHLVRFRAEVVESAAQSVAADPTCALASLLSAYLALMSTEVSGIANARRALAAVDLDTTPLLPRERAHWAAAERWLAGDMIGAGTMLGDISMQYPRDLLALAVGHQIDFFAGNAVSLRDRIGQALTSWTPDDRHFGFVLGMYAFGLEECNLYGLSEETAQRAVDVNADDVWGIHAMAHTYEMQGLVPAGIRFLQDREPYWAAGNFLSVHNSWHYALYLLEGFDVTGALAVYDRVLHHVGSDDVALELVDATSLLWRLHLEGAPVGDRWVPLAEAWARILQPGYYPFNDMHAVMAFLGSGDVTRAGDLVADLEEVAGKGDRDTAGLYMTSRVGLPVCRGLIRFAEGDYGRCPRRSASRAGSSP